MVIKMKKFWAVLAIVILTAFAAEAFAATNPFTEVPASHWAYDAVAQLAAHGVFSVLPYSDGSFKDQQPATRYEIASIIARNLHAEMASKADVEMMRRLIAEFSDELRAIGVIWEGWDDRVDIFYHPVLEQGKLAKLEPPSDFQISDNFPAVDGATAFYPIYAAILNETYNLPDKKFGTYLTYLACSKTPEAYNRLIRGEADVIFVLQPSDGQLDSARKAGVEISLTPIAREAFVFFVNQNNPVSDLTIEQIQDIYARKTTNWRKVGGQNIKILPFQRPDDSGSQTMMLKKVMKGRKITKPRSLPLWEEFVPSMFVMVTDVARYRDSAESIGYSFRFFALNMATPDLGKSLEIDLGAPDRRSKGAVKLLRINGVEPSEKNIRSGAYPLTVEIHAATAGTKNPHAQKLIDWILSPRGQKLVERSGYVGVRPTPATPTSTFSISGVENDDT
jgi:phosphate transport system substrate-binding protein